MSIDISEVVKLSKPQERIVAQEFDRRHPDTGIFDFSVHAKSQFILRKYNENDIKHMKKFISVDIVPQDNKEHVVVSRSIQYGLVVQRYGNRLAVITILDRYKNKTEDNKIMVESVEMEIIWTK